MSDLNSATKAYPFASFLYHTDYFTEDQLIDLWKEKVGEVIIFNTHFFPMKEYYSKEMSAGNEDLLKRFICLTTDQVDRRTMIDLKIWADQYERTTTKANARTVNIDVGLVCPEHMILATGKPYAHRIYLDDGVYAELTYRAEADSYQTLPWSYPDYCDQDYIDFFTWARKMLVIDLSS